MSTALSFTTARRADGAVVLAATGEIDMSNAAAFAAALTDARREVASTPVASTPVAGAPDTGTPDTDTPVVVDLTGVEYLDSAGLAALFPHVERIRLVATPLLAPVLSIAGLDELTTIEQR